MKTQAILVSLFLSLLIAPMACAETICLASGPYCTDLRLVISPTVGTATAGTFAVKGHEYGCNVKDRILYGSMRIVSGQWYFGLTYNTFNGTGLNNDSFVYVYNPATKSGTGHMSVSNKSGTTDYEFPISKVACPVGALSTEGLDPDPNMD